MAIDSIVAHPFLGFTLRPGTRLRDHIGPERARRLAEPAPLHPAPGWLDTCANSHGFYSPVDYPWNPPTGERNFVIGLFGGSVTQFLALQLGQELARDLEVADGARKGRVVVLNFAQGGTKQPQNLLTLTYFLALGQRFDAAVLIDGFGTAALSFLNAKLGFQTNAPSIPHLRAVNEDVSRFAAGPDINLQDEPAIAERIVAEWQPSTRQFHSLCRSERIALLHVLQPNQYDGSRGSAPVERGLATVPDSDFRRGVEVVYPRLRAAAAGLSRDGVPVLDATGLLNEIPEAVFADSCCHYNLRGSRALKDLVADQLRRTIAAGRPRRTR